jgi:hypothetical protein
MTRKFVGWVARSKTQRTRQYPRDVGFHSSTQPTLKLDLAISHTGNMSIESAQIMDADRNIVATAGVEDNGEYYSGSVNINRIYINVVTDLINSSALQLP